MAMSIGARLRMARNLARLSQKDVADNLGVTSMAISKYERGEVVPNSTSLMALAKVLRQPTEYFLRGPVEIDIQPAYRRRATHRGKRAEAVKAEIVEWLERYLSVESMYPEGELAPFRYPLGIPYAVSIPEEVEDAADSLRSVWGIGDGPIRNLTETLEDRGFKILLVRGEPSFDACAFNLDDGSPVIAVKAGIPGDRQRFNLAHELGHLVLKMPDDADHEKLANRFASAFLVPKASALRELGSWRHRLPNPELLALKHKYGMSMKAWVHRAADLEIINLYLAREKYIEFNREGWSREELGEPVPNEQPKRLNRLIGRLVSEDVISPNRAKELLRGEMEANAFSAEFS